MSRSNIRSQAHPIASERQPRAFTSPQGSGTSEPEACSVQASPFEPDGISDINAVVGGYLRDLAYARPTEPKMFGYKRAAAAFALEQSLDDLGASMEIRSRRSQASDRRLRGLSARCSIPGARPPSNRRSRSADALERIERGE